MRFLLAIVFASGNLHAVCQYPLVVTENNNCYPEEFTNLAPAGENIFSAIKKQSNYNTVHFYWFDSTNAPGIVTDAAGKNIFIERGIGSRITKDSPDSVQFCFLLLKEIAKLKISEFYEKRKLTGPNRMLLEAESDYLAVMFFFNPVFALPYPDDQLIKLLATDIHNASTELCFSAEQRQYLFRKAIAYCRQPLGGADSVLGMLKKLVYAGAEQDKKLFSFTIHDTEYTVRYFDSVFTGNQERNVRCGYIQALNPDVWYYRFRICIVSNGGKRAIYYADTGSKIYDSLYNLAGKILP